MVWAGVILLRLILSGWDSANSGEGLGGICEAVQQSDSNGGCDVELVSRLGVRGVAV